MSHFNSRQRPNQQQPKQGEVQLPAAVVMVGGMKGEYLVDKHQKKLSKHPLDVGIDLYPARCDADFKQVSASWNVMSVPTMCNLVLGPACMGFIHPRSSSMERLAGGEVMTAVIDPHFSGDIIIRIRYLRLDHAEVIAKLMEAAAGEKAIAQLIIVPIAMPMFAKWDSEVAKGLTRGIAGFGSTDLPKV